MYHGRRQRRSVGVSHPLEEGVSIDDDSDLHRKRLTCVCPLICRRDGGLRVFVFQLAGETEAKIWEFRIASVEDDYRPIRRLLENYSVIGEPNVLYS